MVDKRHGGAYDRGAADSYYRRPPSPHYYTGGTYNSQRVDVERGSQEYDDYMQGYEDNEAAGDFKDWR